MITVFTEGSPPNKESAEPRLAQAIGDDYVNGRARSDITEVVYPTKQGVCRAEQAQATADDYATGEGNEKSHPRNQKKAHICLPRQCVLFSTKFALQASEIASL